VTQATSFQAAIVGGGPAGLMAAEILASSGAAITVYDRMPTLGRKFLLAGRGGLNLTHSEPLERFIGRYAEAGPRLRAAIEAFPPDALRTWSEGFRPRHRWQGWDVGGALLFETPDGRHAARADVTVLALGGASWPHLGADGSWTDALAANGIAMTPLAPSNCGFIAGWSEHFAGRFAGHPLKNVGLSLGGARLRGEALITRAGLEGTGVYALSARLREAIAAEGEAVLLIDLRPDMTAEALAALFAKADGKQSLANLLRKAANLSPLAIGLMREAALAGWTRLDGKDRGGIAALVKSVPVRLAATAPIERAISTAGGIAFSALDENFMLRARPGVFAAGEMLDWEAPTGGYLLQACFSTGAAAARGALAWMRAER
jgi:uncharacterized flavoprotein (TIGR03862 family)